ncbi:MATE family efflux transporter [Pseudodesulfovibrio tunisiensis]|uniref:MATE family efflux transporter n=1 Tax=Pseudodesulfovibrio tunisiensis TaxID=463192 RepID=UPI001FB1C6D3|nr:MATE family efflux transporter [Pseudodesulfovibrio tunisiensis]
MQAVSAEDRTDLTARPIPELVRQVALPASVGYFFHTMYNVVDTWWAGRIHTEAVAALALALPVIFMITSVGSGIATGSTALMGTALGAKDREQASLVAVQTMSFGLVTSVLLAWLGLTFSPDIFRFLGAEGQYLETCLAYMNPLFACCATILFIYLFNAVLQSRGDTRSFRNMLILGALLNVALDPWFIHGGFGLPAMGIAGVAWSTVLIQAVGCVYLGIKARRTGLLCTNRGRNLIPHPRLYAEIARQGFPASLNFITMALGVIVILRFISDFGAEASAAYGVATRIEQIVLLPTIGLNVAALTITAQNFGACHMERVRELFFTNLKYGAWLLLPCALPVFLLAEPLMATFTDSARVTAIGAQYLRIAAFVLYAYVIIFVSTSALQGMKRPMFAIWMGVSRQIIAPGLLFYFFTKVLGFGLLAVWWSIAIVVWASAFVAFWYARRTFYRIECGEDF